MKHPKHRVTLSLAILACACAVGAGAPPARGADVEGMKALKASSWTVPGIEMKMARIPGGSFTMGSPASEEFRREDETQHKVTISKPFYIGVYELTQEQFYKLTMPDYDLEAWKHFRGPIHEGGAFHFRYQPPGVNHIYGKQLHLQHPMECVSWTRAVRYCKALTAIERKAGRLPRGYEYRLPTEAEWEYACRAGTRGMFNIDVDIKKLKAEEKSSKGDLAKQRYLNTFAFAFSPNPRWSKTGKVGNGRKPNAWGLYDMHGNVAEWVLDSYAPYGKKRVAVDPVYFSTAAGQEKVVRGGSIAGGFTFMRCAVRYTVPYDADYYGFVGLRVVLAPAIRVPLPAQKKR
jgi:formylglycine-generating enzyme required for sulfatase activity